MQCAAWYVVRVLYECAVCHVVGYVCRYKDVYGVYVYVSVCMYVYVRITVCVGGWVFVCLSHVYVHIRIPSVCFPVSSSVYLCVSLPVPLIYLKFLEYYS